MSLGTAADLTELPDGCLPEHGITVVSYLTPQGEGGWGYRTHGDADISALIGLLEMAKHELMHDANPTPCEEDDDG